MEYGIDFSGPGKDIFRSDRATQDPSDAHNSNFLHPVLYYYERLPTSKFNELKNQSHSRLSATRMTEVIIGFLITEEYSPAAWKINW